MNRMGPISSALKSSAVNCLLCYVLMNGVFNLIWSDSELSLLDVVLAQNTASFSLITREKQDSKVVLLGSSIMELPFAQFVGTEDIYTSEPVLLEMALKKKSSTYVPAINYAVEAALVSDQYILLKKYILNRPQTPVLVLGLTPRDFLDARYPNLTDTPTFKTLVDPADKEIWPLYIKNSEQYLQFFSNHISLLFRFRRSICSLLNEALQTILFGPKPARSHPNKAAKIDPAQYKKAEQERFHKSYVEYGDDVYSILIGTRRSKGTNSFDANFKFLGLILCLCHQKHAQLLLINMPLSSINRSLLPSGFYEKFEQDLQNAAVPYKNVTYLDAAKLVTFKDDQDFWDTAHLNEKGGQKLAKLICPHILRMLAESKTPSSTDANLKGK